MPAEHVTTRLTLFTTEKPVSGDRPNTVKNLVFIKEATAESSRKCEKDKVEILVKGTRHYLSPSLLVYRATDIMWASFFRQFAESTRML